MLNTVTSIGSDRALKSTNENPRIVGWEQNELFV